MLSIRRPPVESGCTGDGYAATFKPTAKLNYNRREVRTEATNYALPASILLQLRRKDRPGRMAAVDQPPILRALRDRASGNRPFAEGRRWDRNSVERCGICELCTASTVAGKYI
jgi:hypothetical protein